MRQPVGLDPCTLAPIADKVDGRTRRSLAVKAQLVRTCRAMMVLGNFRPSAEEIAKAAGFSVRTVFQHFAGLDHLHRFAVADDQTPRAILALVTGDEHRLVHAIVTGRLETLSQGENRSHVVQTRTPAEHFSDAIQKEIAMRPTAPSAWRDPK